MAMSLPKIIPKHFWIDSAYFGLFEPYESLQDFMLTLLWTPVTPLIIYWGTLFLAGLGVVTAMICYLLINSEDKHADTLSYLKIVLACAVVNRFSTTIGLAIPLTRALATAANHPTCRRLSNSFFAGDESLPASDQHDGCRPSLP